jgi:hypothetical protein
MMDLPGSAYFLALGALSMTFVGFAAIVITLRQGTGLPLTPLQVLTTSQYIELGLMAAAFAMLAPLLAVSGLPQDGVWRAASAIIIAVRLPTFLIYPRRRRAAAPDEAIPLRYRVNAAIFGVIVVLLLLNVVGWPFPPGPAAVAIAASHTLAVAAALFLRTFTLFLKA